MQMIYDNSSYAIQPEHINPEGLSGIDRKIIELCQERGGWYGFYAQEIGWAEERIIMLKGLFQVGAKFFFKSQYIRRQFALSPAVESADFIAMIQEVKQLGQRKVADEPAMSEMRPPVQSNERLDDDVQFFIPIK